MRRPRGLDLPRGQRVEACAFLRLPRGSLPQGSLLNFVLLAEGHSCPCVAGSCEDCPPTPIRAPRITCEKELQLLMTKPLDPGALLTQFLTGLFVHPEPRPFP